MYILVVLKEVYIALSQCQTPTYFNVFITYITLKIDVIFPFQVTDPLMYIRLKLYWFNLNYHDSCLYETCFHLCPPVMYKTILILDYVVCLTTTFVKYPFMRHVIYGVPPRHDIIFRSFIEDTKFRSCVVVTVLISMTTWPTYIFYQLVAKVYPYHVYTHNHVLKCQGSY